MARYRNLSAFIIAMRKSVGASLQKKEMFALGTLAIKQIFKRTKKGFGVEKTNASRKKLKPLSPRYIKQRKKMKC